MSPGWPVEDEDGVVEVLLDEEMASCRIDAA